MKKLAKGFTLIELMIVVAIIGILAAVAVPQYQNYVIRSKLSEAFLFVESLKADFTEFYSVNGSTPSNMASIGAVTSPPPGSVMSTLTLISANNLIRATLTGGIGGQVTAGQFIGLIATPGSFGITWACSSDVADQYLPSSCR